MRTKSLLNGLAGAAALAGASQAYGTVIVRPLPTNIVGHDPASTTSGATTSRLIDVDGNGTTDLRISYRSFTSGAYAIQQSFVFSLTGQTAAAGPYGANNQYYAYKLAGGDAIPGANQFGQNHDPAPGPFLTHVATNVNGNNYGFWALGDRGCIGFSFLDANSQLVYGYIDLETDAFVNAGSPGGIKFFGLAYETTPGGPITCGAVPEPSTLAALAFGGVGLAAAAFRRRKKS